MRQSAVPGRAFSFTISGLVGPAFPDAMSGAPVDGAALPAGAALAAGAALPAGAASPTRPAAVEGGGAVGAVGRVVACGADVHAAAARKTIATAIVVAHRPMPPFMAAASLRLAGRHGVDGGGAGASGVATSTVSPFGTNSTHVGPGLRRIGWLLASTKVVTLERSSRLHVPRWTLPSENTQASPLPTVM